MNGNSVIQGLWIGDRLSTMERLSIASFLANGHAFHLYAYGDVENVPEGAIMCSAEAIVPHSRVFRYQENGSYAGFSNLFRYKLLLDKGGWWTDMDTICLQPLDFPDDYVFSSEMLRGSEVIDAAVIKAPAGSPLAEFAFDISNSKDPAKVKWGETGPRLLQQAVERFQLQAHVQRASAFCPIDWPDWEWVLDPEREIAFGPETFAVHLWNEVWRRNGRDKDAGYPPGCLFERLKSRYFGSNSGEYRSNSAAL